MHSLGLRCLNRFITRTIQQTRRQVYLGVVDRQLPANQHKRNFKSDKGSRIMEVVSPETVEVQVDTQNVTISAPHVEEEMPTDIPECRVAEGEGMEVEGSPKQNPEEPIVNEAGREEIEETAQQNPEVSLNENEEKETGKKTEQLPEGPNISEDIEKMCIEGSNPEQKSEEASWTAESVLASSEQAEDHVSPDVTPGRAADGSDAVGEKAVFRGIDNKWKTNDDDENAASTGAIEEEDFGGDLYKKAQQKYEFFWRKHSPYSQWHESKFFVDEKTFNCAEQYMMHQKAEIRKIWQKYDLNNPLICSSDCYLGEWYDSELFGDEEIAAKILKARSPGQMKSLGRKVRDFDEDVWSCNCLDIVKRGSIAKFSQIEHLKETLFSTYPKILVEASPLDTIWGIGLAAEDQLAWKETTWQGKNLLGFILTEVRDELMVDAKIIDAKDKKSYLDELNKKQLEEREQARKAVKESGGGPTKGKGSRNRGHGEAGTRQQYGNRRDDGARGSWRDNNQQRGRHEEDKWRGSQGKGWHEQDGGHRRGDGRGRDSGHPGDQSGQKGFQEKGKGRHAGHEQHDRRAEGSRTDYNQSKPNHHEFEEGTPVDARTEGLTYQGRSDRCQGFQEAEQGSGSADAGQEEQEIKPEVAADKGDADIRHQSAPKKKGKRPHRHERNAGKGQNSK